jgi:hypothetical protein
MLQGCEEASQPEIGKGGEMFGRTGRQTDRQASRQTDKQRLTDKQTGRD